MPKLTEEELDQVTYVSINDYLARIDQIEGLSNKLEFSTRYILSHGKSKDVRPDADLEKIIKVAHMKIAEESAKLKEFYRETDANRGHGDSMVDPTVDDEQKDLANQMFIANPVGYLKGKAEKLSRDIEIKGAQGEADADLLLNSERLRHQVFTEDFRKKIASDIKQPNAFDVRVRMEKAFGGPAALQKAYDATKPGILSSIFGTRSLAAANLDEAYKAFNNPNHAFYGNLPTISDAATKYLQHVLPDYRPDGLNNIPTPADIARLSGTQKARAEFSLNILKAAKEQQKSETHYQEMVDYAEKKDIRFHEVPVYNDKIIIDGGGSLFQKQVQDDSKEWDFDSKPQTQQSSDNEIDNELEEEEPGLGME